MGWLTGCLIELPITRGDLLFITSVDGWLGSFFPTLLPPTVVFILLIAVILPRFWP